MALTTLWAAAREESRAKKRGCRSGGWGGVPQPELAPGGRGAPGLLPGLAAEPGCAGWQRLCQSA